MSNQYLKRKVDYELIKWKNDKKRKPLLLRGARQVGKSSTVNELGKSFEFFVEVNFERDNLKHNIKEVFERGFDIKRICDELSLIYGKPIIEGRTLLFLDEIQSCIPAISSLRYFYEELPELHVIAAGSLLEFALEDNFSFPAGRVRSLFMYPFSFEEYLRAMDLNMLADALQNASPENPFSLSVHQTYLNHLVRFIILGGMPEVVATHVHEGSMLDCQQVLNDLMLSFYDDFSKYKERTPSSRLREIFASVIYQTGGKFTYSAASQNANRLQIKESVELLELAGIIHPITHTAANGLPLAAETNDKFRKYLPLDTGIYQRFLQLDLGQLLTADSLWQVNKGALAELFVGLELLKSAPCTNPTRLFYWQREKKGSSAEVDYIIQRNMDIVPIEVKSGTKGSMQSMFLFLSEKNKDYGIRCSMENFGFFQNVKIYPLYAVSNIPR